MRRPALLSFSVYALGIFLGRVLGIPFFCWLYLLISLFFVLLVLILASKERSVSYLLLGALLVTASFSYRVSARLQSPTRISNYLKREVRLRGRVVDEPCGSPESSRFVCRTERVLSVEGSAPVWGKVLVRWRGPAGRVDYGDVVEMSGKLSSPTPSRNPGAFDYRAYLRRRGIYGILRVAEENLKVVEKDRGSPFLSKVILPTKRYIRRNIETTLGGDPGGLLKGVLLGEREAISSEVQEVFSNTGVIHVLAVSGLHVGLVLAILFLALRFLRFPFRVRLVCTCLLLPLYVFITGSRPSVVRATVMAVCLMIGWMLERETDPLNTLGFAGLLILFLNPQSLFDLGFQLSFVATASILYLYPRLQPLLFGWMAKVRSPLRWVAASFTVSLSAQLGVMPLVAYHFFRVPLLTVFANLAVVPLMGAAISLGFVSSLTSLVSQGVAQLFAASNWVVLSSILKLVGFLNSLPFASFRVIRPSVLLVCLYYIVLIGLVNWRSSATARKLVIFSAIIGLNFFAWSRAVTPRRLEATFLDVGRGESCLIQFPNGRTLLVDGGRRGRGFDAGENVIAPFLWSQGVRSIDMVVLSNPYNDHLGGLPYVLESFGVGLVVEAGIPRSSWGYDRFVQLVEEKSIPYRAVRKGDIIEDLGIPIHILHPPEGEPEPGGDLREHSLAFRFTYGGVNFLFPGDCGGLSLDTEVDVLKIPGYGRSGSNPPEFIRALSPEIGVISRGPGGSCSEEVFRRYEKAGAQIYRTERDGAVIVRTDGKDVLVRTMSESWE